MKLFDSVAAWRNRTRIRTQLSLVVSLAVMLLCAVLIFYSYLTQRSANRASEATSIARVLELETRQMDAFVGELKDYSLLLRNDSAFMAQVTRPGPVGYDGQQTLENAFRALFYSRNDIIWMELYLYNARILLRLDNPRRKLVSLDYVSPETLDDYAAFSAGPEYLSIRPDGDGFLRVTRTLIDSPRRTPLAVVRFLTDASMPDRLSVRHAENGEALYLFSTDGTVFTGDDAAAQVKAALTAGDTGLEIAQERCLLVSASGQFGTIAVSKSLSLIDASLNRTRNITLLIGLGVLAVICGLLLITIRGLTRPLEALAAHMRRVGQGDFKERAALGGSCELAGLSEDVNRMSENISDLIDRTYVASLNERTAQLAALEAQTNPHFLFNTLQAIATEAILAKDQKVYRMITTLAALLRYSIRGGNLTALSTELEYVGKYLSLQKARFGERLQYEIEAEEGLMDRNVPKLGLLALAENSIVHGMQGTVDAICLSISCVSRDGMVDIRVIDDGAGISRERLQELRDMIGGDIAVNTRSIGVGNLASRLRLLYDGRARLTIDSVSEPERRTTVRILIPMEER